jgi:uncharacterized protein YfiM (DUF2279 family)
VRLLIILLIATLPLYGQTFIEQKDKQLHFTAGNIAGATGYFWSYHKHHDKKRAMITGVATAFAAGIVKEFYDASQGGYVDFEDIAATTLGGLTINVTLPIFTGKKVFKQRKRRPTSKRK